ncbi:acyltransferase [Streptosporangium pseudovulgare]|uniref:Acyltransferase n=1 Tax=Streptosporangium pseudovulgare TaxID=35765 RepID=A0ABQ2R337_9ACTN|nr:acyltransferase [Streptosporangium pseudovulgare]
MTAVIPRPAGRTAPRTAPVTVPLPRPAVAPRPVAGPPPGRPAPGAEPGRDLFVDVLRLLAMALVVLQHWSMPVLSFADGRISTGNALSAGNMWLVTWVSQVMPLIFFAGGAAGAISFGRAARRGLPAPAWVAARLRRLVLPVVPLAAVWLPLPHLLLAAGLPEQPVLMAARLAGQLLWFLAVYVVVVALTPLLVRLDAAYGLRVPAALAAGAVVVDLVRFTAGLEAVGFLNVAFVWPAIHQLGLRYAAGRPRRPWLIALAGYGAAAALVATGPYPGSMIGMPGAAVSNMAPPTLALLAVGVGQIGLALALRPCVMAFARFPAVSRVLAWTGSRMMTVYLWHMSALCVVTAVVVVGLGISTPEPGGPAWLSGWPHWLLLLVLALWPLLRAFARFEKPRPAAPYTGGTARIAAAAGLAAAGLLLFTAFGFVPGPAPLVGAGLLLAALPLGRTAAPASRNPAVPR